MLPPLIFSDMNTAETLEVPVGVPPLADRTVVVTRPKAQAEELAEALEGLGARVLRFPTIRIAPPDDPERLRRAVLGAAEYDWVVFTSANGVESFAQAASEAGFDTAGALGGAVAGAVAGARDTVRVCCIGPATGRAAEAVGLSVDLVPETHVAEGVLEALAAIGPLDGQRILLPVADGARDVLPTELRDKGAVVDVVPTHRTVAVERAPPGALARLEKGVDLVTFTSPSSVRGLHALVEGPPIAPAAVIGPVTASTARELGYDVTVQAEDFTVPGLVEAVVRHYREDLP